MVLIKMRPGVSAPAALADAQRIATDTNRIFTAVPKTTTCYDDLVSVLPVQRPAEIADYRSVGSTPSLLAAVLALSAIAALGLTLAASVRRRRRDLATLKALGFTGPQLLSAVCWQSSVAVAVGVVAGIPFGIVVGQWLWTLFAREHLRRAGAGRAGTFGHPRRHRRDGLRQSRCHHSRTTRSTHTDGARVAIGMRIKKRGI